MECSSPCPPCPPRLSPSAFPTLPVVILPSTRPEIDSVDQIVVHPCFRSPVFTRYVLAVATLGALPLLLLLFHLALPNLDRSSSGFLGVLSRALDAATFISLGGLLPFYGLLILFACLNPTLHPRERLAIVFIEIFFLIGLVAVSLGILGWLF